MHPQKLNSYITALRITREEAQQTEQLAEYASDLMRNAEWLADGHVIDFIDDIEGLTLDYHGILAGLTMGIGDGDYLYEIHWAAAYAWLKYMLIDTPKYMADHNHDIVRAYLGTALLQEFNQAA